MFTVMDFISQFCEMKLEAARKVDIQPLWKWSGGMEVNGHIHYYHPLQSTGFSVL